MRSAVVTVVTLAIGEDGSKIAYFVHTVRTVHAQRTVCPLNHERMKNKFLQGCLRPPNFNIIYPFNRSWGRN